MVVVHYTLIEFAEPHRLGPTLKIEVQLIARSR